jgi:dolichol-phosphate mannosyltransferase
MTSEPKISILLATYNERENIIDMVEEVLAALPTEAEIVLIDDDSPDDTWRIVEEIGDERIRVIRRIGERGLASAYQRGIDEARGDVIGWLDCDLGMPASLLPKMIEYLDTVDVVVGSRYVAGGGDDRDFVRVFASKLINGFARLVLGNHIFDYDSGFIVLKKSVLESIQFRAEGHGEYFIELLYKATRAGFQIYEVGYVFKDRIRGESKSAPGLIPFLRTGLDYVRRIIEIRIKD